MSLEPPPPKRLNPAPESAPLEMPPGLVLAEEFPLTELKILIYGDSGAGKTHFASACEGVLVVSCEPQGRATIRSANPKALVYPCKTFADVRAAIGLALKGSLPGVRVLVMDSITEIQQMMMDEIVGAKAPKPAAKDGKPTTKGPPPEMTKADWGTLAVKMRNFLRTLRDLPFHVVLLALCEPVVEENTGIRRLYPKLSGSMQTALPAYVNVVGYLYKLGEGQRAVLVDGPDQFLTKSFGPLQGIVRADLRAWIASLEGGASPVWEDARMPGQAIRHSVALPENDDL